MLYSAKCFCSLKMCTHYNDNVYRLYKFLSNISYTFNKDVS